MKDKKEKKYFFFGGMPRTGSILLASILNQNPEIHIAPNSPVCDLMWNTQVFLQNDERCLDYPKPKTYDKIIGNFIKQYYSDRREPYIIDKCRTWGTQANLEMIKKYITKDVKIIYTIRPTLEIITSFVNLRNSNGFKDVNYDEMISQLDHAYLGVENLKEKENSKYALFITYNDIVNDIEKVIRDIYIFLEIPYFKHTFSNIKNEFKQENKLYLKDLHKIRPTIEKKSKEPYEVLSNDIILKYKGRYPLLESSVK